MANKSEEKNDLRFPFLHIFIFMTFSSSIFNMNENWKFKNGFNSEGLKNLFFH